MFDEKITIERQMKNKENKNNQCNTEGKCNEDNRKNSLSTENETKEESFSDKISEIQIKERERNKEIFGINNSIIIDNIDSDESSDLPDPKIMKFFQKMLKKESLQNQRKFDIINEEVIEVKSENGKLKTAIGILQNNNDNLISKVETSEKQIKTLTSRVDAWQKELTEEKEDHLKLKKRIASLLIRQNLDTILKFFFNIPLEKYLSNASSLYLEMLNILISLLQN